MLRTFHFTKKATLAFLALQLLLGAAWAQTETVLYSFTGTNGDGINPYAALVFDAQGNMYGTTFLGGASCGQVFPTCGTVFKLTPSGQETVLYSFTGHNADGADPSSNLIFDSQGNLYGTTYYGGAGAGGGCVTYGCGTVYKLTPSGQETVLYSFNGEADGWDPLSGLVFDSLGNLYGTTFYGGNFGGNCGGGGCGTVFELTPSGQEIVLHSFTGGEDGANPVAGLVFDSQGNLYGTTANGGGFASGVVFKLTPSGQETILHHFHNGADGGLLHAGLIIGSHGNLYGGTLTGGTLGVGNVFQMTTSGKEHVLYNFAGGNDGQGSNELVFDQQGNLYGTNTLGGTFGAGTVFKVTPAGQETVLYSFSGVSDGGNPGYVGLILDAAGNLYGTTQFGGAFGNGTVFKVTP
jgi:uncharacterized repeat protein (TIGR03803 family)